MSSGLINGMNGIHISTGGPSSTGSAASSTAGSPRNHPSPLRQNTSSLISVPLRREHSDPDFNEDLDVKRRSRSSRLDGTVSECREVLICALNPAFQTTLHFESFREAKVNRAYRKTHSIGGKGQNFAMACEQYGQKDKVTIIQPLGGMTGRYIKQVLEEKGLHQLTIPVSKSTRTSTTILDRRSGEMTVLIEPGGRVSTQELALIEATLHTILTNTSTTTTPHGSPRKLPLEGIALCGTLPPGVTGSTYAMIAQLKPLHCLLFVDACQDIEPCLESGMVDLLKINAEEASVLAGYGVDDHEDMVVVAKRVLSLYSLQMLAITNGPDAAYLFDSTHVTTTTQPPQPITTNNPSVNPSERRYKCYKYNIPNVMDLVTEDDDLDAFLNMTSSSLPESTGLDPGTRVLGSHGDLVSVHRGVGPFNISGQGSWFAGGTRSYGNSLRPSTVGMTRSGTNPNEIRMNPLGAGDTCAGVFLIEYLESRDAQNAFRCGLAAASASCLAVDLTAHFERKMMDRIYEKISFEEIDMKDFIPMNPMEQSLCTDSSDTNSINRMASPGLT